MNSVTFDDIIYKLQPFGGATTYWREITSRIRASETFSVHSVAGSKYGRLLRPKCSTDLFHSSYFRSARSKITLNICTVHDLIYERGYFSGPKATLNLLERRACISRAAGVICISNSTYRDLIKYYPREIAGKPISVIHHGPSAFAHQDVSSPFPAGRNDMLDKPFFLYVGKRSGYKNFSTCVHAFAQLVHECGSGVRLVCVGPVFQPCEISLINSLRICGSVLGLSGISDDQLTYLYSAAVALVYPSRYEGFGIPILDSMNQGCPVIASNASSIPEVSGTAALLCDPESIFDFYYAMHVLLSDPSKRAELRSTSILHASTFSWDISAAAHMQFYRSVLASDGL